MVDKIENVQKKDLIELFLTADAKKIVQSQDIFIQDPTGETNIPGRSYVGYAVDINRRDFITLTNGWDRIKDRIPDGIGSTQFYLDIIESYSKR